jgi:hypothetical protein
MWLIPGCCGKSGPQPSKRRKSWASRRAMLTRRQPIEAAS